MTSSFPRPKEIEAACALAVEASRPQMALVRVEAREKDTTRFAGGEITQNQECQRETVTLTLVEPGARSLTLEGGSLEEGAIRELAKKAKDLFSLAPRDPETMPVLGPQTWISSQSPLSFPAPAWHPRTAAWDENERVDLAILLARRSQIRGLVPSGTVGRTLRAVGLASSAGLSGFYRETRAGFSLTARTLDGSGSSRVVQDGVHDVRLLEVDQEVERCTHLARLSASPVEASPGPYRVVLAPTAVASLLAFLPGWMDARAAEEGRSCFTNLAAGRSRLGDPIAHPTVSLRSSPVDPRFRASPFDSQGLPASFLEWIDRGRLAHLAYDRFWAEKQGRAPTGRPSSLVLQAGGRGRVEDLVAQVEEGILVTSLWYLRVVDPMRGLVTGLTRDGTFRIRNGKISEPLVNFRFNDSPLRLLRDLQGAGDPVLAGGDGSLCVCPPLTVPDFQFTALSPAV